MVKLTSSDIVPLLNVTTLSVKFNKKATAKIVDVGIATFKGGEKPKLMLDIEGARYDFVLNATNQDTLGDYLERLGKERDTDAIPKGSLIELEVYDTGSKGQFEFGIRVISFSFPK